MPLVLIGPIGQIRAGLLRSLLTLCLIWSGVCSATSSAAANVGSVLSVRDDAGQTITLAKPAQRIISLAPHTTELLYAAGAGSKLIAVTEYSNYPPEARNLPQVGSSSALDLERIISARPDLIVSWGSGNLAPQVAKLRALGIPVFESEPRDFDTIATSLERLAHLAGTEAQGNAAAAGFRSRWRQLSERYSAASSVTVFYQVWKEPLMTLNDAHMVSSVIRLCGGKNIFGNLPTLAPTVSVEGVLQADPEVILAGSSADDPKHDWQRYKNLRAVRRGNVASLNSDWLTRAGPRILLGAEALCQTLETARKNRP